MEAEVYKKYVDFGRSIILSGTIISPEDLVAEAYLVAHRKNDFSSKMIMGAMKIILQQYRAKESQTVGINCIAPVEDKLRVCSKCGEEKFASEFPIYYRKQENFYETDSRCKACKNKSSRDSKIKHGKLDPLKKRGRPKKLLVQDSNN